MTDANRCHDDEPPVTLVGPVGAVRSIRTVFEAPLAAGIAADVLPAASTARNSTYVWPAAMTASEPAPVALQADQVVPLAEVRD